MDNDNNIITCQQCCRCYCCCFCQSEYTYTYVSIEQSSRRDEICTKVLDEDQNEQIENKINVDELKSIESSINQYNIY